MLLLVSCGPTEEEIQTKIDSSINSAVDKLELKIDEYNNSSINDINKLNEDFENYKLQITNLLSENKLQIYTNSIKGNQPDVLSQINQWNYIIVVIQLICIELIIVGVNFKKILQITA